MIKYLPLGEINARYDAELRSAVNRVMDSGWYLKGEATRQFEAQYADYIGTRYCVACANGLDALTLILRAYMEMGVMQRGDEVIVPANTYIASILAITACGLTPVLVEPRLDTLQIDDEKIEKAITSRTRALMIVHLYGICAYTERIAEICCRHSLKLIEDNAQAHGCHAFVPNVFPLGRHTGSLGDAAGHSFYPGKNLGALGDAGAVTTNDEELARIVAAIGNYGSSRKYVFDYEGRNSRMDELQAAMLSVKLKYLDDENNCRKEIASQYINKVKNPLIHLPKPGRESVWHIFPVLCEFRDELQQYLLNYGVETLIHYPIPPHRQKCYSASGWLTSTTVPDGSPSGETALTLLPITERIALEELSLPCHQAMTQEEVDTVIQLLNDFSVSSSS